MRSPVRFSHHDACFATDPCTEREVIIQRDAQRPSLCLCLVGQAFGFLAEMCQGVGISVEELVQVADSCDESLDELFQCAKKACDFLPVKVRSR
jgi:hypothetical protein